MKKLSEDLKNGLFKNVYLLYGTQAYLRNQYRDKIVNALLPDGSTLNYARYEGDKTSIAEVIDLAETMPFLGDKRVIVLENTGFFNASCDEMAEYIPTIPDTTCMIFSEEKVNKSYKLYKATSKYGSVTDFDVIAPNELKQWIQSRLKSEHKSIQGIALQRFLDWSGPDMLNMISELEKLVSFTFGRDEITLKDVEMVCTVKFEDRIFDMMDAIINKDAKTAFKCYGDMIALQKDSEGILGFLENQLRLMLNCRMLIDENIEDPKTAASILGMNEYRVKKALIQSRKSSKIWIINNLEFCAQAEQSYKIGNMNGQIAMETVLCHLLDGVG